MEYSIQGFAKMAGISTRTLRYYDQIGLLCPTRINSSNYRIYGKKEVDRLQQILFYREIGLELNEIKKILDSPAFDPIIALESHLSQLLNRQEQIDRLIQNVRQTIAAQKGEIRMNDQEKFKGFTKKMVEENEKKYGVEIREKYGEEEVERSNKKVLNMTPQQYEELQKIGEEFSRTLTEAVKSGDPSSDKAQRACELHKQTLCYYYDGYNKEYHKALAEMYVADERFTEYYEKIVPGGAAFLHDAILIYCK